MKITRDEMQVFSAVVDTGSISAAAEQLEMTVSGISRALQAGRRLSHERCALGTNKNRCCQHPSGILWDAAC